MKKIIILSICCLSVLVSFPCKAQNTFPSSGNVGIGTASPQALLDVSGQMKLGKTGIAGRIDFARPGDGNYQSYLGWSTDEIFRQYFSGGGSSYRITSWINNAVADVVTVQNNGNVGIGTTNPQGKLHVADGDLILQNTSTGYPVLWSKDITGNKRLRLDYNSILVENDNLYLGSTTGNVYFSWGNIGIGTTNTGPYKLAVEGTVGARKVKVTQANPWADYVFNDDYPLMSLRELDDYIHQNKHLPDVPSAAEVEKNGLDLGETQALLLKKIEELTLYVIELKRENEKMNEKIEKHQMEIQILKTTKTKNK